MQNKNPNNYNQKDEINFIELFSLLINSKKIIIVITLIFTIIAAFYSYTINQNYRSIVVLLIGNYDSQPIQDIIVLENQINGIIALQSFNSSDEKAEEYELIIENYVDKFLSIQLTSPSLEFNNIQLIEIIDYIENDSKKIIEHQLQQDESQLTLLRNNISSSRAELDRLLSLENLPNSDSRLDVFTSELRLDLNTYKFEEETLANKLNEPKLYEYTKLFHEIETTQVDATNKVTTILLGSLLGLIFSVLIVLIRQVFINLEKNKNL